MPKQYKFIIGLKGRPEMVIVGNLAENGVTPPSEAIMFIDSRGVEWRFNWRNVQYISSEEIEGD